MLLGDDYARQEAVAKLTGPEAQRTARPQSEVPNAAVPLHSRVSRTRGMSGP